MMNITPALRVVTGGDSGDGSVGKIEEMHLDQVFAALSDPIRRRILEQLDGKDLLVSELAAPFDISLQGVSRHIQVLVRAGLVQQARTGRISRCTLEAGPLLEAAVWLNRYAKYWQGQFDLLAVTLAEIDERRQAEATPVQAHPRGVAAPAQSTTQSPVQPKPNKQRPKRPRASGRK
jgi:DNA-binding transcriptional ArsR family regulator